MKTNSNESIKEVINYDVIKAREYLDQMIEIANMFPLYELYGDEIPDYEVLLYLYHAKKTGKVFNLKYSGEEAEETLLTCIEIWTEIDGEYPKLADYAAIAYDSVIGEEVFEKVKSYEEIFEEFEKREEEESEEDSNEEAMPNILRSPFYADAPEVVKLQNFIRLTRITYNMRYLAFHLYKMKHDQPPIEMSIAYRVDWKDVFYHIPGKQTAAHFRPFNVICKSQNNKMIGRFQRNPSFMEQVLAGIDPLQIKICGNCLRIFFAEPRNMKYCSSKCNDRMKSKTYYMKKKRSASGEISDKNWQISEALESLVKKQEKRGLVNENGDFHPFDQ